MKMKGCIERDLPGHLSQLWTGTTGDNLLPDEPCLGKEQGRTPTSSGKRGKGGPGWCYSLLTQQH